MIFLFSVPASAAGLPFPTPSVWVSQQASSTTPFCASSRVLQGTGKEGTGVPTGIWWARTLKLDCFVYIAEQEVTTAQAACLPSRDRWRLGITALWSFVKKRWERSSVACEWHCPLGWRRCGDKDGVTENMSKLELYSVCFFFNCYRCDNISTCFKGQRSTWWPGYILPRVPKNCACLATCRQSAYSNG